MVRHGLSGEGAGPRREKIAAKCLLHCNLLSVLSVYLGA